MNSNNHVWKKLNESSDLTRDLLTIYNKDFFVELTSHFDADPDPLGLLDATLDTARAYIHGWHKKLANKSGFGNFSGRHILKAGVAARNLEYSLSQISKSDLASYILNRNLENDANGKSQKTDQILNYIKTRYGPADPLDIYRIFSGAIASAANEIIHLPDEDETEKQYVKRGDEYSEKAQSEKWNIIPKLPAHYALDLAAVTFKPLWEQYSNQRYYKGRYDESKGGYYSKPANALHLVIRQIDPEVQLTQVGTSIEKTTQQP